ncbi:MAG TPA: hypothetical protein VGD22_06340 [Sphingobacteriaceae bacterium]
MRHQISHLSSFYNYNSAEQIIHHISIKKSSEKWTFYFLPLQPGIEGTINTHARKSIKESTLETEGPLSEKDEVKQAEQRTMEQQKKVEKKQPKKNK